MPRNETKHISSRCRVPHIHGETSVISVAPSAVESVLIDLAAFPPVLPVSDGCWAITASSRWAIPRKVTLIAAFEASSFGAVFCLVFLCESPPIGTDARRAFTGS